MKPQPRQGMDFGCIAGFSVSVISHVRVEDEPRDSCPISDVYEWRVYVHDRNHMDRNKGALTAGEVLSLSASLEAAGREAIRRTEQDAGRLFVPGGKRA